MGVLRGIERRLQGAVGNTFARLFGGSVQPTEVSNALQHEAINSTHRQGQHVVAANHFLVQLGHSDHADIGEEGPRVQHAFSDMLREYFSEQGWDTFGPVAVTLEESDVLHTGQFRVSARVDPDASARVSTVKGGTSMTNPPHDSDPANQYPQSGNDQHGYPAQPYPQQDQPYGQPAGPYGQPAPDPQYGAPPYPGQGPYQQQPYPDPNAYAQQQPYPDPNAYAQQSHQEPYPDPNQYQQQYQQQPYPAQPPPPPMAVLSVGDGSGRTFQLQQGSNVVGRGQNAAFRLPDTSVSRRHADLYFDGRTAVLHDLGSTNGTTVNGATVQTWQLADGDVIRLGQSTVIFTLR